MAKAEENLWQRFHTRIYKKTAIKTQVVRRLRCGLLIIKGYCQVLPSTSYGFPKCFQQIPETLFYEGQGPYFLKVIREPYNAWCLPLLFLGLRLRGSSSNFLLTGHSSSRTYIHQEFL